VKRERGRTEEKRREKRRKREKTWHVYSTTYQATGLSTPEGGTPDPGVRLRLVEAANPAASGVFVCLCLCVCVCVCFFVCLFVCLCLCVASPQFIGGDILSTAVQKRTSAPIFQV